MSSPVLSFGIVDAAIRKYKCGNTDGFFIEEMEDYDEENNCLYCVVIKMFIVQPKSLQECHIFYQPTLFESDTEVKSTLSFIEAPLLNNSSKSAECLESNDQMENNVFHSILMTNGNQKLFDDVHCNNLMLKSTDIISNLSAAKEEFSVAVESKSISDEMTVLTAIAASSNSSPSREVQEILSLKDDDISDFFCYDNGNGNDENKNVCIDADQIENIETHDGSHENVVGIKTDHLMQKPDWPKAPIILSPPNIPENLCSLYEHHQHFEKMDAKFDKLIGKFEIF